MNFSETSTAAVSRPPGLLRRSRISAFIPLLSNFSSVCSRSLRALLLELTQLDVRGAVTEILGAHRVHADLLARDVEVLRLRPPLADDRDGDLGARPPAHALDGVRRLHVLRGQPVDLHDAIARVQAGAIGRRAFDGRHDGEDVVLQRDLDAETPERAGRLDLHILVGVGIEEGAVRVEAAEGALDRAVDELLGRHFVDVLGSARSTAPR